MFKKFTLTLLILILLLPIVGVLNTKKISAETDDYGYSWSASSAFEVDWIDDNGKFVYQGEKNTLADAENLMRSLAKDNGNNDYCVRYKANLSPMHIVSMIDGFAYSYPGRNGSPTMNIYQSINGTTLSGKYTYVERHYEMDYLETERLFTSGQYNGMGMVKVSLNGFVGYCDLECVDLVPRKLVTLGKGFYLGGNNKYETEYPYKIVIEQNYYYVKEESGYRNLYFHYARSYANSSSTKPTDSANLCIGVAPDFMSTNNKYYSNDGVNFFTDGQYKNYIGSNYNYYQFLSFRTKTGLNAADFNNYIVSKGYTSLSQSLLYNNGQAFIDGQNKYGMNALLIFSLAIHESYYGTSQIARGKNNLFGINAIDVSPGTSASSFSSVSACINDLMGYYLAKYTDYDHEYYASPVFGNKSVGANMMYASDPYWGMKIAGIAYSIDKYVAGGNGKLKDYNAYNLALVTTNNAKFLFKENGNTAYTASLNHDYQKSHVVTVLETGNEYSKIQSSNPISNGQVIKTQAKTKMEYNYDSSVLYVKNSDIKPLNYEYKPLVLGDFISSVSKFEWLENGISISGLSYQEGLISKPIIKLMIGDVEFELAIKTLDDVVTFEDVLELNDLAKLKNGTHTLKIKTEYKDYPEYSQTTDLTYAVAPQSKTIDGKIYSFTYDDNKLLLKVNDAPTELKPLVALEDATIENNILTIKGVAAISSINSDAEGQTVHTLIIQSYDQEKTSYEIECIEKVNDWYDINDGFDYTYTGFEVNVDLNEIDLGEYALLIKTEVGEYNVQSYLSNISKNYANIVDNNEERTYRLSTNSLYSYRFELSIMSTIIDYSSINKPSTRSSMISYDNLSISEEGNLSIDGLAMIYYLDYPIDGEIAYDIYLVSSKDNYLLLDNEEIAEHYNYKDDLGSTYNLSNIEFKSSGNLCDLEKGEYSIIVKITNGEYIDFVEVTSRSAVAESTISIGDTNFTLYRSNIRNRMMLRID